MQTSYAKAYRVGDWELVPSLRRLFRGQETLTPRAKVFDLLLYLVEARDRLVTREELISLIWGGTAVSENSLAQCMIELRKLLGDDARNPRFIQTFPKAGYQLICSVEEIAPAEPAPTVMPTLVEAPPGVRRRTVAVAAGALVCAVAVGMAFASRGPRHEHAPQWEVAWWQLEADASGHVRDSSGSGLHGDLRSGARPAEGKLGSGLWLDGLQGAVIGKDSGALPAGSASRSITLWMKPAVPLLDDAGIFTYGSEAFCAGKFSLDLLVDGRLSFGAAADKAFVRTPGRWDDGNWRMVTATYESAPANRAQIFVDGKRQVSEQLGAPPATESRAGWRIGQFLPGRQGFRGVIDDIRVYRRALSEAQVNALYRCSSGALDLESYYYMPVFYPGVVIEDRKGGDPSTPLRNDGKDFSGIQFARTDGACGLAGLSGADVGQDLKISADLLVPRDAAGHITEAGPYFRSRGALPGEGLIGGTSAGYWVQLTSTGAMRVKRLNPKAVVAFSPPMADFDSTVFHKLDVEARGEDVQVRLDGKLISFEQGNQRVEHVRIPPLWEGPPRTGNNEGAAGFAFGAEENRGKIGGQRARNLRMSRMR